MSTNYQKVVDFRNNLKPGYYDGEDLQFLLDELIATLDKPDTVEQDNTPWIGVDFDGTLAHHVPGQSMDVLGDPIMPMLNRIKVWVEEGIRVKIFTARATHPPFIPPILDWLESYGLPRLEVTNKKDFRMVQLWDDRAIQVLVNEGIPYKHPYESIG